MSLSSIPCPCSTATARTCSALPINPEARAMLEARWKQTGTEVNEARLRMARIPEGASLIVNSVSAAPFQCRDQATNLAQVVESLMVTFVDAPAKARRTPEPIMPRIMAGSRKGTSVFAG